MTASILISQDLSCAGQVSMTVALPLLGALGFRPTILPTALLSTHTGGLGANTYLDLSSEMTKIITHWETLPLSFSAIYLGYLGNKAVDVLLKERLRIGTAKSLWLIDPVMGDHGRLYRGFTAAYVTKMRKLAAHASLLTPNVTEAQLLLGQTCTSGTISNAQAHSIVGALKQKFTASAILLTGVQLNNGQIGVFGSDAISREIWELQRKKLPGSYFGTGDLFASILLATLLKKKKLKTAATSAMDFVSACIENAQTEKNRDPRFGLDYSQQLSVLLKQLT
ncbi:pyridoxamine kinase [Liquorilactobacillus satsumensis]|uniref:pyridoxamine kinase n=1 Tax=Liquorilactobacillus satsumensis TaxID=259059 RepID=UPI0039E971BB